MPEVSAWWICRSNARNCIKRDPTNREPPLPPSLSPATLLSRGERGEMQKSRHKFTLMSTARVERDHGRIYRRGNSILKTQLLSTWIAKDHSLRFSVSRPRREYAVSAFETNTTLP